MGLKLPRNAVKIVKNKPNKQTIQSSVNLTEKCLDMDMVSNHAQQTQQIVYPLGHSPHPLKQVILKKACLKYYGWVKNSRVRENCNYLCFCLYEIEYIRKHIVDRSPIADVAVRKRLDEILIQDLYYTGNQQSFQTRKLC